MFKFIRRVSTSLLPRPDRPWRDDATSNAPTIGRKRRFSLTDHDDDPITTSPNAKKVKGESVEAEAEGESTFVEASSSPKEGEAEDVKSVTRGVEEVELGDNQKDDKSTLQPEGIPLPASPRATPQPEVEIAETNLEPEVFTRGESHSDEANDTDSVASSSGKAEDTEHVKEEGSSGVEGAPEARPIDEDKADIGLAGNNEPEDIASTGIKE
ncbi:hypothetical protein BJ138DRAFT_827978 [Hygrophoropsis aurantiaca]|uniref:Uncharacterized protein n=1 Tax=Hygrophoropsis aurantiaca TaxID=72124 RepID=A0ACB8ARQ0_9AGAM|nr:hypothetical protein BJ138DRAFT_827978 [Hygrophoropsis aurantiaca]